MINIEKMEFPSLDDAGYSVRLPELQKLLSRLQIGLFHLKKRAVIVLEGSDAAGKGGAIHRMIQAMDPRGYRVYPIGPPDHSESERHYLQRFWKRIPHAGQLAIFDRSWYGRVLVERVDNLAGKTEWQRAYREINDFERLLVDDGVIVVKLLLIISKEEQRKRFLKRLNNPHKQWKLTLEDLKAHEKTPAYLQAFEEMLDKTSTEIVPWKIVPADNKKYARIAVLEAVVKALSEQIDLDQLDYFDKDVYKLARSLLENK